MRISYWSSDVCSSDLGFLQNNAMQAAQLVTLGFSRSQELEADQLGVQYLKSAGYDPLALSTMLASLANQTDLEARIAGDARSIPEWASPHPDPASRVRNAQQPASRYRAGGVRNADARSGERRVGKEGVSTGRP